MKKEKVNEKPKCSIANCSGVSVVRGVCPSCYSAVSVRVKSGMTTWEELERLGIVKSPKKRGPPGERGRRIEALLEAARKRAKV